MKSELTNLVIAVYATWLGVIGREDDEADTWEAVVDRAKELKLKGLAVWGGDNHLSISLDNDELVRRVNYMTEAGINVVTSIVAMVWGFNPMGTAEEQDGFVGAIEDACKLASRLKELGVIPKDYVVPIRADSTKNPDDAGDYKDLVASLKRAVDVCQKYGCVLVVEPEVCWKYLQTVDEIKQLIADVPGLKIQFDYSHMWHVLSGTGAPEGTRLPESMEALIDEIGIENIGDVHIAQTLGGLRGSEGHDETGAHDWLHADGGKVDVVETTRILYRKGYRGHISWDGCMIEGFADIANHRKNVVVLNQAVEAANSEIALAA